MDDAQAMLHLEAMRIRARRERMRVDSVRNKTFNLILMMIFLVLLAIISCLIIMIFNAIDDASVEDMLEQVMGELTELESSQVPLEESNDDATAHFNGTLDILLQDLEELSSQALELNQTLNSVSLLVSAETLALASHVDVVSLCAALRPLSPSGLYWIMSSFNTSRPVYCDAITTCGGDAGGWVRVSQPSSRLNCQDLDSFSERIDGNIRTCVWDSDSTGCGSIIFPANGIEYSLVCGNIVGYQLGFTNAFRNYHENRGSSGNSGGGIESTYVDGVSLTHGSPRQHIWTFAAALDATGTRDMRSYCPCQSRGDTEVPPEFVGADYFCDTAVSEENITSEEFTLYTVPLWKGMGSCTCCSSMHPPWFYKQLPRATTDDIEMRVCRDDGNTNEDIAVETVEIYIH